MARKVKLPAGIDEAFVEKINGMTTEQLKAEIVSLQVYMEDVNKFKEKKEYTDAKTALDLVAGPARDAIKAIRNKTKLIVERLAEKGKA